MTAEWAEQAALGQSKVKRRSERQIAKQRYALARERAQAMGVIPTVPEGAVRNEVVNPATQGEQDLTSLDRAAISMGWSVPEEQKPRVIQRLLEKLDDPEITPAAAALIAGALVKADQIQFERDRPAEAAKAAAVTINNNVHVDVGELLRKVRAQREQAIKVIDVTK